MFPPSNLKIRTACQCACKKLLAFASADDIKTY